MIKIPNQLTHGINGWRMSRYDWDEETGWATVGYTRVGFSSESEVERVEVQKFQPAYPRHVKMQREAEAAVAAARRAVSA